MNKYTVRVTAQYNVDIIAEYSGEAKEEAMKMVQQMAVYNDGMTAICLGWEVIEREGLK